MRFVVGLVAVAACAAPPRRALDYRNKAREQFNTGQYGLAVADYLKAKDYDPKRRIPGVDGERERAAQEFLRLKLRAAWDDYYKANYEQAHNQLLAIKLAHGFGVKDSDKVLDRALSDTAAQLWAAKVDPEFAQRHYLKALLTGEYLLAQLPIDHALRTKLQAVKAMGTAFHMAKMRQLKDTYPAAAAFHYLVAQRLGAPADIEGLNALGRTKSNATGDPTQLTDSARAAAAQGRADEAENFLVMARAAAGTSGEWTPAAGKFFGGRYGLDDDKLLNDIWNISQQYTPFTTVDAEKIPDADVIEERITGEQTSDDIGERPKTMDFSYAAGTFNAPKDMNNKPLLETGLGASLHFPSTKTKSIYEISGHLDSEGLGGKVNGYGGELLLTKLVTMPLIAGVGIGYSKTDTVVDPMTDPTGTIFKQKSLYVPIVARMPLALGYAASVEYRANILQYTKDKDTSPGAEQHFSSATARIWGPIPLLSEPIKFLRNFTIELNASYVKDAPNETEYGGRLLYRRSISKLDGDDDDRASLFAQQTAIGPTIDMWYEGGRGYLLKADNAFGADKSAEGGLGIALRFPSSDEKSGVDIQGWFHSSSFGGNVGGYGIEYVALRGGKSTVFGYGIGLSKDWVSELPTPTDGSMNPDAQASSFHTPIIIRFPIAKTIIAALEGRVNWLQLGGTGNASADCRMMQTCENRHFSPIGVRIWMPIPILGDAIDFINKFHLEGHATYYLGAKEDDLYGNNPFVIGARLVWRPIQSKR